MEIAVLVSAGILLTVLGGLLGVALGRYVWPAIRESYTGGAAGGADTGYRIRGGMPFAA